MSDDISQLIGRLRSYARSSKGDIFAAVDTIEALRAERDRLKDEVERLRNEKVGTHGTPELDEDARKLEAMGQDTGMTLDELFAPDPDLMREDAHERKRIEKEYPWKE